MRDLARSLRISGAAVPVPWPSVARLIKPRSGNLMVVLAAPGVGKSSFALSWAAQLRRPCLYLSLDTSLVDQAVRIIAIRTHKTVEEVQAGHDEDLEAWIGTWEPVVKELDYPVRFCELSMGVKQVDELVAAEVEYWGEPPAIVFVDNVGNLLEKEESASEYRRIFSGLHRTARERNTLVIALHHIKRKPQKADDDEDPAQKPVHMSDGLYTGEQEVQFLLGLWRPHPNELTVAVLKNRMGPADPGGHLHTTLRADLARASLRDPREQDLILAGR
jgi:hypothetical protein